MSNLIKYAATRANALKKLDIKTRATPTEVSVEKYFRSWPFHEIFINHIEDMGWMTYLVFTKSSTDYNIAKDFGLVKIEKVETDYQALEIATQPTDNIKKLKLCGLYSWRLNSSNETAQDFLAEESENYH